MGLKDHIPSDQRQRCVPFGGDLLQHGQRLVRLGRRDDRDAGLDDSGFFARDQGQGIAKDCHVIVGKRCDHRNARRDNIGGIQPPAQSHLDDRRVRFLLRKIKKADGGGDLKCGQFGDFRDGWFYLLNQFDQLGM